MQEKGEGVVEDRVKVGVVAAEVGMSEVLILV